MVDITGKKLVYATTATGRGRELKDLVRYFKENSR
jgi:hypothetical protein